MAAGLLGLAACAGPSATAKPQAESPLERAVKGLLASEAEKRLGSVRGIGFVKASIVVFLAEGEVALIPSTPELEADMLRFHRRWQEGRRQPLSHEQAQEAFTRLTAHRLAVGRLGGESLIRFAHTDAQGKFTFEQVPAGRWLAVTDMSTPVSGILWAIPIEVKAGEPTPLYLVDGNILLEGKRDTIEGTSKQ
jgi:hypothetical protein